MINRRTAFFIITGMLFIGAIAPWATVLGMGIGGPIDSLELGLVMFGSMIILVISAILEKYMRPVSFVLGVIILLEATNTWIDLTHTRATEEFGGMISVGWGLYFTIITGWVLVLSTWVIRESKLVEPRIVPPYVSAAAKRNPR